MIKKTFKYIVVVLSLLFTVSCSSVESDAKKAASLINKSVEQSKNLELEKAEKTYLKAYDIMNKYAEKEEAVEFYTYFAEYRDKEKKQNAN